MTKIRVILYAPNVHTGGGLTLLHVLLSAWRGQENLLAFLDIRVRENVPIHSVQRVVWISPTLASRALGEMRLFKEAKNSDRILCFHGLPPMLPLRAATTVFQQNRLYFSRPPTQFRWRTRIRLEVERKVAYWLRRNATNYVVQTPSMAREFVKWYGSGLRAEQISIVPFGASVEGGSHFQSDYASHWDLLYVADGEAHKNHRRLVSALVLLAREGIRPSLALTLPQRNESLIRQINMATKENGLKITNLGSLCRADLEPVYRSSRALIYPSIVESFGLPLIEARRANLPIIAGELDYVRDVCDPTETFDPQSEVSIARAIRRFLRCSEAPIELQRPETLWAHVLGTAP